VGGNGFAIGPARFGTKMKSIDEPVGRDFPVAGHTRLRLAIGAVCRKSLEQGIGDATFQLTGDDGRVERFGLGTVEKSKVGPR